MICTRRMVCIGALLLPALVMGKQSGPHDEWLQQEAQWLITKAERKVWKGLKGETEQARFIELFWARRDPTPGTARNEFREEYQRRLLRADEQYGTSRTAGRLSDQGRVYCLLGPPTRERTSTLKGADSRGGGGDPVSPSGAPTSVGVSARGALPPIAWVYEDLPTELGVGTIEFDFVDYEGFGSYALDAGGASARALKLAVDLYITQPELEEPPVFAEEPPGEPAPPGIENERILEILAGQDAGSLPVGVEVAQFFDASGLPFNPVAVGVLQGAPPAGAITFVRVQGSEGIVREIEGSVDEGFRTTLRLPPGHYRLQAGILDPGSGSHGLKSRDLDVPGPKEGLVLSSVVLASAVETLEAAAPEFEPFTFGRVRLVPNLTGTFASDQELMIFLAVYHVDDPSGAPDLSAAYAFDRNGKFWNEIPDTPQPAVRLSEGRYLLTQVLPLGRFAAADYTLTVTVQDRRSGQTAAATTSFVVK